MVYQTLPAEKMKNFLSKIFFVLVRPKTELFYLTHGRCNIVMPAFGFWDSDLVTCGLKKLFCNLLELLIGSLEINLGDEQCFCWSLED